MSRYLIVPDSFKGSLTAPEAADIIADGIIAGDKTARTCQLPLADGGEGTLEAIHRAMPMQIVHCPTFDALMRPITADYGITTIDNHHTAIIEVASATGLTLISPAERDIMKATSYGTGVLIADAYSRGIRHFIIGLGGSATCDGGEGVHKAIAHIDPQCKFKLMCDVDNPLIGPRGAARVFGPQKGATPSQINILDRRLAEWAEEIKRTRGINVAEMPGAGAAGGLGAMFMAYFDTTTMSGIDTVLDLVGFDKKATEADWIITGEGRTDSSTLHGKVAMGVMRRARRINKPVIVLSGSVADHRQLADAGFTAVLSILQSPIGLSEAMNHEVASRNLMITASQISSLIAVSRR